MPVLMIQVRNDSWTKNPEDVQKTLDMLGASDKEMIWVEHDQALQGWPQLLRRYPEKVLAFFDRHMKVAENVCRRFSRTPYCEVS
jgi:hypothetical protein